ncbi:MAG: fimbria/pilus periplasmic chaperone, partial [Spirochaeta sp.]
MKIPNMRLYLVRLNIFALLVCGAFYIHGFTIQPISQSFQPSGPESSQVFLLQNPGERTVAVELRMLTRELQPDGSEVRNPADNEFSIFPQRVILEPDERRTIRVRWLGRENPEIELSYRLLAEQLPVDFDEQDSSDGGVINLMFRYLAAVYITPEGAEPEIRISLDEEPRGDGTEIP